MRTKIESENITQPWEIPLIFPFLIQIYEFLMNPYFILFTLVYRRKKYQLAIVRMFSFTCNFKVISDVLCYETCVKYAWDASLILRIRRV
jgi:hypothetical protein